MSAIGIGVLARGRIAWVLAIVFGIALTITGAAIGPAKSWSWSGSAPGWLVGTGAAFAALGLIFLILSYVSRGQTD
jgi:hypothetical protein